MNHQHDSESNSHFGIGLILNTGFTVFEMTVGLMSGSLALVADAAHNLTDSLTLAIAYIAERISKRQPDVKRTYGYGRVKIIAALLNSGILLAIATFITIEAIQRLSEPKEVPGLTVAVVALIGIAVNGGVAYLLSKRKHDLNTKAAYTNMLYDTLSSVGALLAGLAIYFFNIYWLDSVVGIGIAFMLLIATFGIAREVFEVLLEGVPRGVDLQKLRQELINIKGVKSIDDVHAWAIDNDNYAFSCHIVVEKEDLKQSRKIVETAKELLDKYFGFGHSTIEVELDGCQPDKHGHI